MLLPRSFYKKSDTTVHILKVVLIDILGSNLPVKPTFMYVTTAYAILVLDTD